MMKTYRAYIMVGLVICIVLLFSCINHKNRNIHSSYKQTWIEASLEIANQLLESNALSYRLIVGEDNSVKNNSDTILVKYSKNSKDFIMYVPQKKNEILLNQNVLTKYLNFYCKESSGELSIEKKYIGAVMLLHELGHIINGDNGSFDGPIDNGYNTKDTKAKGRELNADKFVAKMIKVAMGENQPYFLEATYVSWAITKFSWNLSKKRIVDNFGADKSVYWDKSYTHPNLELRFLILNNEIVQSDDSESLIHAFIEERNKINNLPIYEKE